MSVVAHRASVGAGITIRAWDTRIDCDHVFSRGRFVEADFDPPKPTGPIELGTNRAGFGLTLLKDPRKGPCTICDVADGGGTTMIHVAAGELVSAVGEIRADFVVFDADSVQSFNEPWLFSPRLQTSKRIRVSCRTTHDGRRPSTQSLRDMA